MTVETVLGLLGSLLSIAGITTSYVISMKKAKRELDIVKEQEALEAAARAKAEKQKFYLTAAANLVVSAEKLELSGPQKKEYVMTWLENEAIKAEIEVDRALMSVAIERTILILNDFKGKEPVSELLSVELDEAVKAEQERIEQNTAKALTALERSTNKSLEQSQKAISLSKNAINDVKSILSREK